MNHAMMAHSAIRVVKGEEMQGAKAPTRTTALKIEELLARATTLKSADLDAAASPTSTNSPKRTNPTTLTRPMMANSAKIPTRRGASRGMLTY
jgi:hypothetical protein